MKYLSTTSFFMFLCLQIITAQKVVKKSIVNTTISSIQIDVSNCFETKIETTDSNEILVEGFIDGEYQADLNLVVKEEGSTLIVSSGFMPIFVAPNDKLSAHKVVSIALKIKLPQYKNVRIFGTSCNVGIIGDFERLKVTLSDGACILTGVTQDSEIITQSGDIIVNSSRAKIKASSAYGSVEENEIPLGNNNFILTSITGDIRFKKTE